MIDEILMSFRGMSIAKVLASYFCAKDGSVSEPISIGFVNCDEKLISLESDNNGGIRLVNDLEQLFFDEKFGYAFVAPLLLIFKGKLVGHEVIESVSVDYKENLTTVEFKLDNSNMIMMRFEDDELMISLK